MGNMKTQLNKRELAALISISNKIQGLRERFDEESGNDIELRIEGNGTVGEQLSIAAAAIETILQEYN